ncbi:MAG: cyclic nucleotide-binding domain-containing protein [Bdellovibrionaceae bacterium]|nr:cyclic nucleotide-binding domain-containing protein [Pseudobdellovibrionaceae bacterium]MBX3032347.1 cyclic nucleotide-binding domain-containing protein [Pseudobdellovibrionaceae bacterium]
MSTSQKTYKKGEILFKDGDKVQNIIFIQSGGVNQCLLKGKKNIDLFQLGANQVMGETALIGQPTHMTAAIATSETKTVEIAPDVLKAQYEGAPPVMKMLIKSLIERLKQTLGEVRSNKISTDSSPIPEEFVPQIFGSMFFTARHKGEKEEKGTGLIVEWGMMRSYCQRVFGQSLKRLEQAANLLVKLKLASYEMGKLPEDPEGPDVILRIKFPNVDILEAFFEFYQYYYYKPGKGEILKYDDFCAQLLEVFVSEGEKIAPDRFGIVSVEFNSIVELVKEKMGINFNNDHFARLENKGVLCKRRNIEGQGVRLEFELRDYQNVYFSWRILREIDKWNEKGFVDMDEKEEKKSKKTGLVCPACAVEVAPQAKFCHECGHKLVGQPAA